MLYKEDWEQTQERLLAYWDREIIDRVCIQVTAPKENRHPITVRQPSTLRERWTNVEYVLDAAEAQIASTYWGGEAFPHYWPNLGPDLFAGLLGAGIEFGEDTTWANWQEPLIKDWAKFEKLVFDRDNSYWKLIKQLTELALERGQGKFVVGITDIHPNLDALAALCGPERLCLDLADYPEQVKAAMRQLGTLFFEVIDELYEIIRVRQRGVTCTQPLWCPEKWYGTCSDFICLLSPTMAREFVYEEIVAEITGLERSLFHLDGHNALPHLDFLLSIPELDVIQWVPDVGEDRQIKSIPILQKIQRAGKCVQIWVDKHEVETLLRELDPKGLMITTWAESEEEAGDLLRLAEHLTVKR